MSDTPNATWSQIVTPGGPAVCLGTVVHHRHSPTPHRFSYPMNQVWLDPDEPDELCRHHRLWSSSRPAPIWFRRRDYLDGGDEPMGPTIRQLIALETGQTVEGPIRILTQPRTWGWVFNPITIYLAWSSADDPPAAAVLEVTNTPWKERHHYAVSLTPRDPSRSIGAEFNKRLHVSPFLGMDYRYRLDLRQQRSTEGTANGGARRAGHDRLTIGLDVLPPETPSSRQDCIQGPSGNEGPGDASSGPSEEDPPTPVTANPTKTAVLTTTLTFDRLPATPSTLGRALHRNPLPTHRVSAGIHHQATRLLRKRVPFVSHPKRKANR